MRHPNNELINTNANGGLSGARDTVIGHVLVSDTDLCLFLPQ